jgi:hypothetical protein
MLFSRISFAAVATLALPVCVSAQIKSTPFPTTSQDIQVTVTNEGNSSFTVTPLWFAFQDGTFDLFDVGSAASPGVELIAESGGFMGPGSVDSEFTAAAQPGNMQGVVTAPGGFGPLPVIEPGETGTAYVTPINPANYQYFTYAAMIVPSNDTFIGNSDPMAHRIFNDAGEINDPSGTYTIQVFGSGVYDSGTELNDGMGAAFSTLGGTATDTTDNIAAAGDLMEFDGTTAANGDLIDTFITPNTLLATITISQVPEPTSLALAVLSAVALTGTIARRRRN